jgi:DNA repair protein RadC
MSLRIHDLPESDRPRERLIEQGAGSLSNAELLAIFINTGLKGENAVQVGTRLLKESNDSLRTLSRKTARELSKVRGLGPAKGAHIAAAFELGIRAAKEDVTDQRMDEPSLVYDLLGAKMARLGQEELHVLILNTRMKLVHAHELTAGTLNESVAHPRDIIGCAVKHNAHAFILAHNHPSGDPSPSEADRQLTRRIRDAAELMRIIFADHVIIGAPRPGAKSYFSFREAGML